MKKTIFLSLIIIIILLSFSCEEENLIGFGWDSTKIKSLITNFKTEIKIPETDKKFNLTFKPFFLNNRKNMPLIINIFKEYFGDSYSADVKNSYKFVIDLRELKSQYILDQNDKRICLSMIDCPIKIYSPEKNLLLELNVYVRNEKIPEDMEKTDDVIMELINKTYNEFLTALNENKNYLDFIKSDNPVKKVRDDSVLPANKLKHYKELMQKNKNEYRLLFSLNEELNFSNSFNLLGLGNNFDYFCNLGFEIYPHDYFSIEYKTDLYTLIMGNSLGNTLPNYHLFIYYHELAFNTNFNNFLYCSPVFNVFLGHAFQFVTGYNYLLYYYDFNSLATIKFANKSQTLFVNALRVGLGISMNIINPYITRSNGNTCSIGFSAFYSPCFFGYKSIVRHMLGFDVYIKYKFNAFIYREKPHKFVNKLRFRMI